MLVDEELVVASLVLVEVIVCVPDDVILEVAVLEGVPVCVTEVVDVPVCVPV